MPQFDFYTFPGQVCWTLLGFFFFHFFVLKFYTVKIAEVMKMRSKLDEYSKYKTIDIEKQSKLLYGLFFRNTL